MFRGKTILVAARFFILQGFSAGECSLEDTVDEIDDGVTIFFEGSRALYCGVEEVDADGTVELFR